MTGVGEVLSSTEETPVETVKEDEPNEVKLLFFGTFYHDSSREYNADLVQFRETTRVTEIRVIPLGATVTLPNGSFQLGATNPSEFELEVYYNDLQCPTKSTFELLSYFNFNDKSRIQLLCDPEVEIITDGILVRGLYSTVTLAMYGHKATVVIKEPVKEEVVVPDEEPAVEKLPVEVENSQVSQDTFEFERRVDDSQNSINDVRESKAEARVSTFIPPVDVTDIPQAIPTINTRVSFDPIIRNLLPEDEEPFEEEMHEIPVTASDAELSSDEPFDGVIDSPVVDSTHYQTVQSASEFEYTRRPVSPGCQKDMEDISDGEVPSSLENDDSCTDFSATPKSLPVVEGNKQDLPDSPSRGLESMHRENESKIIPSEDIVSPPHDQLSDQDDSMTDDFHEPGFEEIISDEEVPEYNESEYFAWQDFTPSLLSKPFNHLSESFQVVPLNGRSTGESLFLKKKSPEESWDIVISAADKYSPDNFESGIMENWVEMLEIVIQYVPTALSVRRKKPSCSRKQVESTLLFWAEKGLNYKLAKEQISLPYKVRHIKAGLRLVQCLLNYGGEITKSVLRHDISNCSVQHALLNLLTEKHMNIFTKLLIIRTLDATVTTREGFKMFVTTNLGESCFQRVSNFMYYDAAPTRISYALRALMTKLNIQIGLEFVEGSIGPVMSGIVADDMITKLTNIYQEIQFVAQNVDQLLSHPTRILPASVLVELPASNSPGHNAKVSFVRILEEGNFMKLCTTLLNSKEISIKFIKPIRDILHSLAEWEVGLIYMCNQGESMSDVLKFLFPLEDEGSDCVGSYVSYCLEVMRRVHQLSESPNTEEESLEELRALQTMYSFLSTAVGKKAIVNVLSKGNLISPILDIFTSKVSEKKSAQYHKIAKIGFAAPILTHVVQTSEPLQFLQHHGERIHDVISNIDEKLEGLGKLKSVFPFLTATLTPVLMTYDGIDQLCDMLRSKKDDLFNKTVAAYENFGFPAELTTILRILYSLGVPNADDDVTKNLQLQENETLSKELKYKLAIVKMHSLDCISLFSSILSRITEEFSQPAVHAYLLCSSTGDAMISLVSPLIKLLRLMISEVIKVRKSEFRDTSLIPVLLQTHALMCAFPKHSSSYERAQEVAVNIIQTLLCYTSPTLKVGEETEEELNKSTWTALINDIVSFTMTGPYTFIAGLQIFAELLPLPLPIPTRIPLNNENTACSIKMRRLWSAYLHGASLGLQNVIGTLLDSSNTELLRVLKRVCIQLGDLSSSTCLVVSRAIVDPILESLEADLDQNAENPAQAPTNSSVNAWVETSHGCGLFQCSAQTVRRLGFFVSVMNGCGIIKCGVMHAIRGLSKVDEKYSDLISQFASIIIPQRSKPSLTHLQAQEHVVTIFQAFCDVDCNLLAPAFGTATNPCDPGSIISNSLPQRENLSTIINALLEYINTIQGITSTNCHILEGCFRVLSIILDTDYGFIQFKMQLEKFPGVFKYSLKVMTGNSDVQTLETSWPCITSLLELMKLSIKPSQGETNVRLPLRGHVLSSYEIGKCLAWLDVIEGATKPEANTNLVIKSEPMDTSNGDAMTNTEMLDTTEKLEMNTSNSSTVIVSLNNSDVASSKESHPLIVLQETIKKYQERTLDGDDLKPNQIRASILETIYGALDTIQYLVAYANKSVKLEGDTKPLPLDAGIPTQELLPELYALRPVYVIVGKSISESDTVASMLLSSIPPTYELDLEEPEMITSDLNELARLYFKDYDVIKDVERVAKLSDFKKFQEPEKRSELKSKSYDDYHRRGGMNSGGGLLGLPPRKPAFNSSLRGGQMRGFSRGLLPGPGRGGPHFDPFRSRPPNTSRPPSLHVDDFVAMESGHGSNAPNYKSGMRSNQDNFSNRARGNSRGNMGRPYNDGRSRPYRQPQSGNPYYQHQQRHDGGANRGRMGRGRGYNANDRWSNDNQRGGSMLGNYGRQDHSRNQNQNYDDKFRSGAGGGSTRNSNMSANGSRQQPYNRNNYRDAPSGPRSGGGGGPMESSQRWKDKRNFTR